MWIDSVRHIQTDNMPVFFSSFLARFNKRRGGTRNPSKIIKEKKTVKPGYYCMIVSDSMSLHRK